MAEALRANKGVVSAVILREYFQIFSMQKYTPTRAELTLDLTIELYSYHIIHCFINV